jgi:hypothetical protein
MSINDLSPAATKAAMIGGTEGWGKIASSVRNVRYVEAHKSRRKCQCGCGRQATHLGMCNGIALVSGCELKCKRWARATP